VKPDETDLERRLAASLAGTVTPAGDHPGVEELTAYRGGELDAAAERRVQDHLASCRDCLDELLELDSFLLPADGAPSPGVGDLETAAAWRAMRGKLPLAAPSPARPAAARRRRWTMAAAAVLLVAVGALSLWSVGEHRAATALRQRLAALSRPQTNAAIIDLFPAGVTRSEEGETPPAVELPADAGHLTLVVNLPPAPGFASYEAEIVDAEGHTEWSGGGLTRSRFDTLRLGLPRDFLAPGDYALRVLGDDGDERREVATYPLRVPPP
jgi:hypothetical protein